MSIRLLEKFDLVDDKHHIRVQSIVDSELNLDPQASHFVVIHKGEVCASLVTGEYVLRENCFGSFPGAVRLEAHGNALIISSIGYESPVLIGGPIERKGRLRYIDGCTASLLIPPPVRGEPCLNCLRDTAHALGADTKP